MAQYVQELINFNDNKKSFFNAWYCNSPDIKEYYVIYMWFAYISHAFELQIMLLVGSIVFLKSPKDILEGCSKLDCLIKVSIFQYYKFNGKPTVNFLSTSDDEIIK